MLLHATSRRNVIIALMFIWFLVCGGLSWATWSAIRLEKHKVQDIQDRSRDKTEALALAHLNGYIDATLGPERNRPVYHFKAIYRPTKAYHPHDESVLVDPPRLISPLQTLKAPDWLLLHFQASPRGWSSPQLVASEEFATPISAIPAADRERQASAANWLAALRGRYDPFLLLQEYEAAHNAEIERRTASKVDEQLTRGEISRTDAEFARRGERLLQLQREHFPEEQCEPQLVAMENLQTGEDNLSSSDAAVECVLVSPTPMLPVWLDLTMDGRLQLAFVRSVKVEHSEDCTLQGALIDWNRLRAILEEEIQPLLPGAKVEPVRAGEPWGPNMLLAIPARIASVTPAVGGKLQAIGWRWDLMLTWGATLLALLAISYGTMKYVAMVERRMRFVSAVTHELRTPLTSFQLYTDLLADMKTNDDQKRGQYIDMLRRESKRLARLVENVLVYSKIGGAKAVLRKKSVAPEEILSAIQTETSEQCQTAGKQLTVENQCGSDLKIETDSEFVVQILSNLVENACKYSAEADDPRIWLTAKPAAGQGVAFEVEDAGQGILPGDRKTVFEPFRRSDSAQESQAGGMGLGLALSKYWATCLGGQLSLKRSERNGEHYSRFVLNLPNHIHA